MASFVALRNVGVKNHVLSQDKAPQLHWAERWISMSVMNLLLSVAIVSLYSKVPHML